MMSAAIDTPLTWVFAFQMLRVQAHDDIGNTWHRSDMTALSALSCTQTHVP